MGPFVRAIHGESVDAAEVLPMFLGGDLGPHGKTWRQAVAQASTALTRLADAGKAVWVRLHGGGSLCMTHTDADELLAEVLAARDHAAGQRQEA